MLKYFSALHRNSFFIPLTSGVAICYHVGRLLQVLDQCIIALRSHDPSGQDTILLVVLYEKCRKHGDNYDFRPLPLLLWYNGDISVFRHKKTQ
uniref:Ovule protein n=1 Tax=Heterorhabditis bacteriophora TaxID=37862 RepID=A0A1I7WDT5_HETBA